MMVMVKVRWFGDRYCNDKVMVMFEFNRDVMRRAQKELIGGFLCQYKGTIFQLIFIKANTGFFDIIEAEIERC